MVFLCGKALRVPRPCVFCKGGWRRCRDNLLFVPQKPRCACVRGPVPSIVGSIAIPTCRWFVYSLAHESEIPLAHWRNAIADLLRHWAVNRSCNRIRSMAKKAAQPATVRSGVRRVGCDGFSSVGICEVDQCRRPNPAILHTIGLYLGWRFIIWRLDGQWRLCASIIVALAQGAATKARSRDRTVVSGRSPHRWLPLGQNMQWPSLVS